ncbi:HD-GYP domain-containing protein [Desulfohalovibrio reitneri]|uniref:HD-GYP domain-containing protein n=1 Tax=Desulfohalovibrio reitneri TaxID=1307759 RepID=UPI00068B78CF|nr:HD-GYP domain-containing protein [Desulfohalovibrio reitneri]
MDIRDPITGGHSDRVAKLSLDILRRLDLPEETVDDIYLGALIHDIGKIGIPDAVLNKPGKLDYDEMYTIRKHPELGREIMGTVPLSETALRTLYEHHERYDGSGYPRQLRGEEISLGGRILAVADVFDALNSDRPYRKGLDIEQVCSFLWKRSGTEFDPQVVDIALSLKAPGNWRPPDE